MEPFRFRPSARLQKYLGRELIADPNLAIIEFVKNAYDADASDVWLEFTIANRAASSLLIADNGEGMNREAFERNWMHPGYSGKVDPKDETRSRLTHGGRTPAGEKGLGRLAAGRLGVRLDVFTRKSAGARWLHIPFDWDEFDTMSRLLDEIEISYDYETPPPTDLIESGTALLISGLSDNWGGRVRGRPVAGRSRTRLGRLKQDLQLLLRPLLVRNEPFVVHLTSDAFLSPDDVGEITPREATTQADYVYDFEYRVASSGEPRIKRSLKRSARLVNELGGTRAISYPVVSVPDVAKSESRPATLRSGPFKGRFMYTPPPAARRAREIDAVGSGVLLYRDGVLVEPYGLDGNDWVGVEARKAQRQGYALVQPATFSGWVLVDRRNNPALRDMSNRLGLIENEEAEEFVEHVRAEFSFFEGEVFDELRKRWESLEEKAARESERAVDLAGIRLRAIVHSLGQPLLGLATDVSAIRQLGRGTMDREELVSGLEELVDSSERHIRQVELVLRRFRDVEVKDRAAVPAKNLVEDALTEMEPLAISLGVDLRGGRLSTRKVIVHRDLLLEAIKELMKNAVEAVQDDPHGWVEVATHQSGGDVVIDVRDNGPGIPDLTKGPLTPVRSTKGHPGEGLATVLEIVLASRGRVRVASSGPAGTHIEVHLPTRLTGVVGD